MKLVKNIDYYKCTACEGKGYRDRMISEYREAPWSDTVTCSRCHGKGFVIDTSILVKMKKKLFGEGT